MKTESILESLEELARTCTSPSTPNDAERYQECVKELRGNINDLYLEIKELREKVIFTIKDRNEIQLKLRCKQIETYKTNINGV